jgi:hypothetical protein
MSDRITSKRLEGLAQSLNTALHLPLAPYTQGAHGKLYGNEGHLHIDFAFGGACSLCRMHEETSVSVVLSASSRRALFDQIHAYWAMLRDLQTGKFQYLSIVDVSEEFK